MVPIWPLSGYNHYINCDLMGHENCLLGMWLATTTISCETQETKIRLVINHEKLGFNVIEPLNIGIFHGISWDLASSSLCNNNAWMYGGWVLKP